MSDESLDSPDVQTLIDWLDGRLPPERAELVARQVGQGDARTEARVAWLRGVVTVGKQLPLEDPPPVLRQRLRAQFARWRDGERAIAEEIRHFDAAVLFDSRTRPRLAGVRGDVADEVLHLAYTTPAADLVLDVQRLVGNRVRIDGQLLLTEPGPSAVEAVASGPGFTVRTVDGDELGRFQLDSVPAAADRVRVTNGEITLDAPLDLRPDVP